MASENYYSSVSSFHHITCFNWVYSLWLTDRQVAQSCPTLCDPIDCSLPGSSAHGILQARVLEWVAVSFSRRSSQPRDRTWVSRIAGRHFTIWAKLMGQTHVFCVAGRFFTTSTTWEALPSPLPLPKAEQWCKSLQGHCVSPSLITDLLRKQEPRTSSTPTAWASWWVMMYPHHRALSRQRMTDREGQRHGLVRRAGTEQLVSLWSKRPALHQTAPWREAWQRPTQGEAGSWGLSARPLDLKWN